MAIRVAKGYGDRRTSRASGSQGHAAMNLLVGVAVVVLLMLLGSLAAAWLGLGRPDVDASPSTAVLAHEPNGDSARSASDRPPVLVRYQM